MAGFACRLRCLDIARGCTVALMLFVNHVGKEPEWIAHAPWNGLHLADLVMPCFLLIVGMSAALSLTAGRKRGAATSDLLQRVLSRAGRLFCANSLFQHSASAVSRSKGTCACREALCPRTAHTGWCRLRRPLPCMGPCSPSCIWRLATHCRLLSLCFTYRFICPRVPAAETGGISHSSKLMILSANVLSAIASHIQSTITVACQLNGHEANCILHCKQARPSDVAHGDKICALQLWIS